LSNVKKKFDFLTKKYKIFFVFENRLITKKEVQEYLRISSATLDRLIKNKNIPHIKLGRRVLFKKSDIDKFLESKKVK